MAPRPSIRYGSNYQATTGFWGDVTGTIDWCEPNYVVTRFIAEFWNSLSNLAFIVPPLVVAWHLRKQVELPFTLSLVFMALTGIGSFAFHATLTTAGQLWDELGMVWSGLFVLYILVKILRPKDPHWRYGILFICYGLFVTSIYLFTWQWVLFQVAYGVIHFSCVITAWQLRNYFYCDTRLYWATIINSTIAFTLWNIDNQLCDSLERIRDYLLHHTPPALKIPAACATPFTQFHALWHIFAGYGCFCMVVYTIQAKLSSDGRIFKVRRHWLSGLTLVEERDEGQQVESDHHHRLDAHRPEEEGEYTGIMNNNNIYYYKGSNNNNEQEKSVTNDTNDVDRRMTSQGESTHINGNGGGRRRKVVHFDGDNNLLRDSSPASSSSSSSSSNVVMTSEMTQVDGVADDDEEAVVSSSVGYTHMLRSSHDKSYNRKRD